MRLIDLYPGGADPFEGDRTLTLRSLPEGARVTRAVLTLTPAPSPVAGAVLFQETFVFGTPAANELSASAWGVTKVEPGSLVEVDFHARRTLVSVAGNNIAGVVGETSPTGASLQVDMGGAYVDIASDGAFNGPGKTAFRLTRPNNTTPHAPLPGLTISKFKLTRMQGTANLSVTAVTIRSVPTNVSARLGLLPPFWTRPGDLASPATSPDFAAVLNAFLAEAQPQNGFYSVPFTLHSDSLARLDVEVTIDFVVEQPVLPPHLPQATATFGASTRPSLADSLTTVALPRQAAPVAGRSSAQIQGQFQSTRVAAGLIGDTPAVQPVEVSPIRSLAQAVSLDNEVHVLGVDLPLSSPQAILSGLHIAFQFDDDGKPSGDILPGGDGRPASAAVRVDRPLPNQSTWGIATFSTPVRLQAAQRYWLVLQSTDGRAFWDATPGTATPPAVLVPPLLASEDGGLAWRVATAPRSVQPLATLIRLRHQLDHFTIPVQLQIGSGPNAVRRRLNEFDPLGRVEFTFDFAQALSAHLAAQATAAPCATDELLVNGSFDDPRPDDATRRLFGFDAASGPIIMGNVDLSQGANLSAERFITLVIDSGAPQRINCAGANPARTTLNEIVAAINRSLGANLAFASEGNRLAVNAPDTCIGRVDLLPWQPPGPPQGWADGGDQSLRTDRSPRLSRLRWPIRAPQFTGISVPSIEAARGRIVAALAAEAVGATVLAQIVTVNAGCVYVLRGQFDARRLSDVPLAGAANQPPPATASWEAHWRGDAGQNLRVDRDTLDVEDEGMGFLPFEVRLIPAEGASQVELRFIQPPPGLLLLDDVSFAATFDRVANSTFALWQAATDGVSPRQPRGWTLASGDIEQTDEGARLISGAQDDAVLLQTVEVKAGQRHTLTVQAGVAQPLDDADGVAPTARARLELHWLGDGPIGAPVIISLDGRDFITHTWTGEAPAGATRAELRLVQPAGGVALSLNQVMLTELDIVRVPLIFLSETPGELTVSNLRVAYDLPSPPRRPTNGSARATLQPPTPVVTPAPPSPPPPVPSPPPLAPPLAPTPVEPVAPAAPPGPLTTIEEDAVTAEAPETPAPTLAAVSLETAAPPPTGPQGLVDIKGIGPARAEQLAGLGIASLDDLAAASAREIAVRLRGVSEESAEDFIRQARQMIASEPRPSAPAPATDLPLTLVGGLGAVRVARLTEVGIDTVQKLAEAAPEDVARVLRGVSLEMAAGFIGAAQRVLDAETGSLL